MKNSFRQAYDTKTLSDGSVEISFKSKRFGFEGQGIILSFAFFLGVPTGCVGIMAFVDRDDAIPAIIVAFIVFFGFLRFLIESKFRAVITVKPNVGLIFAGKSLPFSDIKALGFVTEVSSRNGEEMAYIEAKSLGNAVRISSHIKPELASAIVDEIKSASGYRWG